MESLRSLYKKHGFIKYYEHEAKDYSNPHAPIIAKGLTKVIDEWNLPRNNILDLASGNGLVTKLLTELDCSNITSVDPYLGSSDTLRYSFDDITNLIFNQQFSLTICCFALHLLESSKLPSFLYSLREMSPQLLIISPHKRPVIKDAYNLTHSTIVDRVHFKRYQYDRNIIHNSKQW